MENLKKFFLFGAVSIIAIMLLLPVIDKSIIKSKQAEPEKIEILSLNKKMPIAVEGKKSYSVSEEEIDRIIAEIKKETKLNNVTRRAIEYNIELAVEDPNEIITNEWRVKKEKNISFFEAIYARRVITTIFNPSDKTILLKSNDFKKEGALILFFFLLVLIILHIKNIIFYMENYGLSSLSYLLNLSLFIFSFELLIFETNFIPEGLLIMTVMLLFVASIIILELWKPKVQIEENNKQKKGKKNNKKPTKDTKKLIYILLNVLSIITIITLLLML